MILAMMPKESSAIAESSELLTIANIGFDLEALLESAL